MGAAAVVGGMVVAAGVGAYSASKSAKAQSAATQAAAQTSADATKMASDAQATASKYATDVQKKMYDQTRTDQTPWRTAGVNALSQLTAGTKNGGSLVAPYKAQKKFTLADFEADPGYNFRLKEGINALDSSAAARGGLFSGAQAKALTRYGQDVGSSEYANAYNRYQSEYQNEFNRYQTNQSNRYNRLASMAGLGQTANNALQAAGTNYANSAGNNAMTAAGNIGNLTMTNAANAANAQLMAGQSRASAYQGYGQAVSGLSNSLGNYYAYNQSPASSYSSSGVWT